MPTEVGDVIRDAPNKLYIAGEFQDASGATACKDCTGGNYCVLGASAELPCEKGTYSASTNLDEAADCTDCPLGSSCATGSTDHALCAPGTYTDALNQWECTSYGCD